MKAKKKVNESERKWKEKVNENYESEWKWKEKVNKSKRKKMNESIRK